MISGIILAAGLSTRMGANKLLLPVDGTPVIERVLAAASNSKLEEVVLVCREKSIADIGRAYGVKVVENPNPELGQSRSVRLGVENSCSTSEGFMFLVADQPFISDSVINRLIDSFESEICSAVVPVYSGERGNPVIFSSTQRERLMSLQGDVGGRVLLREIEESIITVEIPDSLAGSDMDIREQYEAILRLEDKNE